MSISKVSQRRKEVINLLSDNELTRKEIAKQLKISYQTSDKIIAKLMDDKIITRRKQTKEEVYNFSRNGHPAFLYGVKKEVA